MSTSRNLLIMIVALGLVGLSAASYVFVTHSLGYALFCPFATGCDAVQDSPYAVLLGIPVSFLGMLGFSAYIALALIGLRSNVTARWCFKALLVLSVMEVVSHPTWPICKSRSSGPSAHGACCRRD